MRGDNEEAKSILEDCIEGLIERCRSSYYESDELRAANACERMGDCLLALNQPAEAVSWYERCCELLTDNLNSSKSLNAGRKAASGFEKLFDVYIALGERVLACKWYEYAKMVRNHIVQGSNTREDALALEVLQEKRHMLHDSPNSSHVVTANKMTLRQYQESHSAEWASEGSPSKRGPNQETLEKRMGRIMLDFAKTHPLASFHDTIAKLGRMLIDSSVGEYQSNARQLHDQKWLYCSRISDAIMKDYVPIFKYDEEANLINLFCGYFELTNAKRVRGGRDEALSDMKKFYRKMLLRDFPVERMEYKDDWLLIDYMIINDMQLH